MFEKIEKLSIRFMENPSVTFSHVLRIATKGPSCITYYIRRAAMAVPPSYPICAR